MTAQTTIEAVARLKALRAEKAHIRMISVSKADTRNGAKEIAVVIQQNRFRMLAADGRMYDLEERELDAALWKAGVL